MQTLMKATVLGLGLLTSGTAMANNNFGGSPLYNPQYSYYGPPYYSGGYWNYNQAIPNIILAITTLTATRTTDGFRGLRTPTGIP